MFYGWALAELIEASVRDGQPEEAAAALSRLTERTRAAGTEWALGTEARCRGLLTDDESCYQESVERLGRSRLAMELARSRLVYGEWLRRQNRRTDAREQLRAAHDMFAPMGAAAFAERTRRELSATGETVRSAPPGRSTSSPRKRHRSPGSPPRAAPTPRSVPCCSSAPAPWSTTCTKCSPSSASAHAETADF